MKHSDSRCFPLLVGRHGQENEEVDSGGTASLISGWSDRNPGGQAKPIRRVSGDWDLFETSMPI